MENFSFTTIIEAGKLTESDNVLTMIQGLAMDQAQGVATWLSLATGCNVHIRRISPFGETEIEIDYEQEMARLNGEAAKSDFDSTNSNRGTQSLTHVTISTGHSNDSPRHEVANVVIEDLTCWIKSAKPTAIPGIEGKPIAAPVPNCQGYLATFSRDGDCLLVTLFHEEFGPCVTFGVAPSHSKGGQLWALLGSKESQPTGAWCGVKFEPGLLLVGVSCLTDMWWFGDFERCVAWAWISILEAEEESDPQPAQKAVVEPAPINEGAVFDYDEAGPRLRIFMPDPTETEIQSIRRGDCQFKLVVSGPVIFLMAKFADMHWMDAPYSIHLLPSDKRKLCSEFVQGKRYSLMVTLIDSRQNVQCGSRVVTWNPHFSAMFHDCVKSQLEGGFSRREYEEIVGNIYASSTSAQMRLRARAHTKGGD